MRQTSHKRRSMAGAGAGQAVFWAWREIKIELWSSTVPSTSQGPSGTRVVERQGGVAGQSQTRKRAALHTAHSARGVLPCYALWGQAAFASTAGCLGSSTNGLAWRSGFDKSTRLSVDCLGPIFPLASQASLVSPVRLLGARKRSRMGGDRRRSQAGKMVVSSTDTGQRYSSDCGQAGNPPLAVCVMQASQKVVPRCFSVEKSATLELSHFFWWRTGVPPNEGCGDLICIAQRDCGVSTRMGGAQGAHECQADTRLAMNQAHQPPSAPGFTQRSQLRGWPAKTPRWAG